MSKEFISMDMELDLSTYKKQLDKALDLTIERMDRINKKMQLKVSLDENGAKNSIRNISRIAENDIKNTNLKIKPEVILSEFKKDLEKTKLYARDTKKEIDPKIKYKMLVNIDDIEQKIDRAKKYLKTLDKNSERATELRLGIKEYKSKLTEAKRQFNNYVNTGEKGLSRLQAKFNQVSENSFFSKIKSGWLIISGVITTVIGKLKDFFNDSSLAFNSYQTAFTGFRKTLEGTEDDFRKIEKGIISLSKSIPKTVEELSQIAEVGGQMGIAKENILVFTETVAKLSTAISGITAEDASQKLARIMGITGDSIGNIDRLASSLVELGNNFKANEGEILNFAERLAGAGAVVDMSSADILGIATAFVDVGVNAEAGGTAVQKALLTINNAVNQGGEKLQQFASLSKMSADEFIKLWKEDSAAGFTKFVDGLTESGDNAANVLGDLIGTDVRLARAFLSVAKSGGTLEKAIKSANKEFLDANALQEEFTKKLQTNDAQQQINANRWKAWQARFGGAISSAKIAFNKFFLQVIPYGFALVQTSILQLATGFYKGFNFIVFEAQKLGNSIKWLGNFIKDTWDFIFQNTKILGDNILLAFKKIPNGIIGVVNSAIETLEKLINAPIQGINDLVKQLEKIPKFKDVFGGVGQLGTVNIGRIQEISYGKGSFTPFKSFEGKNTGNYNYNGIGQKNLDSYNRKQLILDETFKTQMGRIVSTLEASSEELGIENTKSDFIKDKKEQFEKLKDILDDEDKAKSGSSKKTKELKDKEIEQEKRFNDFLEKKQDERLKKLEKGLDIIKDYYSDIRDEIKKSEDKIKDFNEEMIESQNQIKGLKKELEKEKNDSGLDLEKRRLKIVNKIAEIEKDNIGLKSYLNLSKQSLNSIGSNELSLGITGNQVLELKELYDELNVINKNKSLLINPEVEKKATETESDKILREYSEKKKAILDEKQLELNKFYEIAKNKENEKKIYNDLNNHKIILEKNYSNFLELETQKRIGYLDRIKEKTIEAQTALFEEGITKNITQSSRLIPNGGRVENVYNFNIDGSGNNAEEIAKKVYDKIESQSEEAMKNYY